MISKEDLAQLQEIFLDELEENVERALEILGDNKFASPTKDAIPELFRIAHTIKGSARGTGFAGVAALMHDFENVLDQVKRGKLQPSREIFDLCRSSFELLEQSRNALRKNSDFRPDGQTILRRIRELALHAQDPSYQEDTGLEVFEVNLPHAGANRNEDSLGQQNSSGSGTGAPDVRMSKRKAVRVLVSRIDEILNLAGEMVVLRQGMRQQLLDKPDIIIMHRQLNNLEKLTDRLQQETLSLRLTAIRPVFQKAERAVEDLARQLGKMVRFETLGHDVELDKLVVDRLGDILIHLLRNALDHGIESGACRRSLGKHEIAALRLEALQQEDKVEITIEDDGFGIDRERVLAKAVERGIISDAGAITEHEAMSLIFASGFSTREQVTAISGRGVGLDAVQIAVQDMHGSIDVWSERHRGTRFTISLPLSLSIIGGVLVNVRNDAYVIPTSHMKEVINIHRCWVNNQSESKMISVRDSLIPVVPMSEILYPDEPDDDQFRQTEAPGIIVSSKGTAVCFLFDRLFDRREVVLKKLGPELQNKSGFLAATVLGSGEPAMVLNLPEIIEQRIRHAI